MKYFARPQPLRLPNGEMLTYDHYLALQGQPPLRATVMGHPVWRASAENVEHWEAAQEALAKPGKYIAMPDDAFAIFKPLAVHDGEAIDPVFMPMIKPVLRATSTKPDDYDATQEQAGNGQAETASAN